MFDKLQKGFITVTCCDNRCQNNSSSIEMDTFLIYLGKTASPHWSLKRKKDPAITTQRVPCYCSFQDEYSVLRDNKGGNRFTFFYSGFATISKHKDMSKAITFQRNYLCLNCTL